MCLACEVASRHRHHTVRAGSRRATARAECENVCPFREPCDHLVQLYTDEGFLARAVAEFIGGGLAAGEAAVIIATPAHVALFQHALTVAGREVPAAEARGQLVIRDAQACLDRFMVDGWPDRDRFFSLVRALLAEVRAAG